MALGKRPVERQPELWVATAELPRSPGHPFFVKLNALLAADGFDAWLETLCAPHYHAALGRPSIPPGVYFRMILVGYFEGIASQRGIAWRCRDSRSLAAFLGFGPTDETPDHSSLTRVSKRLPKELHESMFQRVLAIAAKHKLLDGKTVGVDSTTLEANAAMKSIVRKDTGEDWQDYVTRLMREAGQIAADHTPTAEEIQRFDRRRKDKTVSNAEWQSETDADAHVTKMKDGSTHLAYKGEHVIDLESEFALAVTVHSGTVADTKTIIDSVMEAQANLQAAGCETEIEEVVADKGYHAAETLELADHYNLRTYIPEKKQHGQSHLKERPVAQQRAVKLNHDRMQREKGKRLRRRRSERVERSFAHLCETGGARRCWLRGLMKVTKRYLLQAAARNLGLILRKLFGMGTPRGLQGIAALRALAYLIMSIVPWADKLIRRSMIIRAAG